VYEVGPDGRVVAKDEKRRILLPDGSKEVYIVKDHYLVSIEKIGADGKTVSWITPSESNHGIEINADDTVKSGTLHNFKDGWTVEIKNNEISKTIIFDSTTLTDAQIDDFIKNGTSSAYLASVRMVVTNENGNVKVETTTGSSTLGLDGSLPTMYLISANGIANPMPENVPPQYETAYRNILAAAGADPNSIYLLPVFEQGTAVTDFPLWIFDAFTSQLMTKEIITKMDALFSSPLINHDKPIAAVLYSGSFNPFMMALGDRPDYNVDTVVSLGGPSLIGTIFQGKITNPNIKAIYNVYGSNDVIPLAAMNKTFTNFTATNVKILGATHFDYFYDANRGSVNDKVSKFVEEFTKATMEHDDVTITNLLHKNGVTYDDKSNTYTVDISNSSFTGHNS